MTKTSPLVERIDLRFRAAPAKKNARWLPGGVWIWFSLGLAVGAGGWIYAKRQLTVRLARQVEPNSSTKDALIALDALGVLKSDTEALLVLGLQHTDARVARSAWEKLCARVDQWTELEPIEQQASIIHLADQLAKLPQEIPEANKTLVRSLAAKLFAICVAVNDTKLNATIQTCQRLISMDGSAFMRGSVPTESAGKLLQPPEPLPPTSASTRQLSPSNQLPSPPTESLARRPYELGAKPLADSDDVELSISNATPNAEGVNEPSLKPELPVLVKTPASIASFPVARVKQISDQPDLRGIEKAEIAELVRLLASDNPNVAKAAALALRGQGLSDRRIELATELAVGSAARRLELLQQVAVSNDFDPRPWLIWMAEDGQPEVRKMAVSLLSSMLDQEVQRSLRILVFREQDTQTKELMRKVLLSATR